MVILIETLIEKFKNVMEKSKSLYFLVYGRKFQCVQISKKNLPHRILQLPLINLEILWQFCFMLILSMHFWKMKNTSLNLSTLHPSWTLCSRNQTSIVNPKEQRCFKRKMVKKCQFMLHWPKLVSYYLKKFQPYHVY